MQITNSDIIFQISLYFSPVIPKKKGSSSFGFINVENVEFLILNSFVIIEMYIAGMTVC